LGQDMRHISQLDFSSWDEVINAATEKAISQNTITGNVFVEDIRTIASVSHPTFFSRSITQDILDLVNQIKHFDPERARNTPEMTYAFIDDIHRVAGLIKEVKKLPNSARLFGANIFSHEGMYIQFLLTVLLSRYFEVVDMEVKNSPLNTDIVISFRKFKLHLHVKDIREETKHDRIEDSIWAIDSVLRDKANTDKLEDKQLHVAELQGAPPVEADEAYWINYAQGIENKPQLIEVVFKPEDGFILTKPTKVKIKLKWRPHNHTYISPTSKFSNTRLMMTKYDELEAKLLKAQPGIEEIHILAVITDDEYDWTEFRESLKDQPAGILFCSVHGFYIQHSPIMLPEKYAEVDAKINGVFPSYPYWSEMSDKKL
jgi:hypothetical protein